MSELEWWASDGEKGTAPRNSEVVEGPTARHLAAWKNSVDYVRDSPLYNEVRITQATPITRIIPRRAGDKFLGQHLIKSLSKKRKEKRITETENMMLDAIYQERKKFWDRDEIKNQGKGAITGSRSITHPSGNIKQRLEYVFRNNGSLTSRGNKFQFVPPKQSTPEGVVRLQFINMPTSFTAAGGIKTRFGTDRSIHDIKDLHYHFYGDEKRNGVFGHIKFVSNIGRQNVPVTFFIEIKSNGKLIFKLLDSNKNTYREPQCNINQFKIILKNFMEDYGVTKTVANKQVPFLLAALQEMKDRALSIYRELPSNNGDHKGGRRKTYKRKRKSSKRKTKKRKNKRKTRRKRKTSRKRKTRRKRH